jgi:DNA polymerase/3'-5' exonuclease PolX
MTDKNPHTRLPLVAAEEIAGRLVARFDAACERIMIAGDIRCRGEVVDAIALVATPRLDEQRDLFDAVVGTPNLLDKHLEAMIADRHITAQVPAGWSSEPVWTVRLKRFWLRVNFVLGFAQVDLAITPRDQWGAALVLQTGPPEFVQMLMKHLHEHTPYRHHAGYLVCAETGGTIAVPDEGTFFRLLGLEYVAPEQRSMRAWFELQQRWQRRQTWSNPRQVSGVD